MKIPYTVAGKKNMGWVINPRNTEVSVPTSAKGGARYRKLTVPGWLRETTLRQRPY